MNDQLFWIWLMSLNELSIKRKFKLLNYFEKPEHLYNANKKELLASKALREKDCQYIRSQQHLYFADKAQNFMAKHQIDLITLENSLYPECLKNIYDPPVGFFTKGDTSLLNRDLHVGIVGSRKASPTGRRQAKIFAGTLAKCGVTVVSGLADGIDSESHRASLDKIGSTIAVMGTGINVCYPKNHQSLYKEIVKKGLIITEFFMDEKPLKYHFPQRNRLISGLSDGLLVVEARNKSGALITANFALEQGKNVYAIPGDVSIFQSVGSNQLIKDGAKVVTEPKDILEDYIDNLPEKKLDFQNKLSLEAAISGVTDPEERKILNLIAGGHNTIDNLLLVSNKEIRELNAILSMMELNDLIKVDFGQIYIL
ncbi:MAG: DNA-processing protein DprA [Eubacterium sp.]